MRTLRGTVAALMTACSLFYCSPVSAVDATEPPVTHYSPVYISAFQTSRTNVQLDTGSLATDSLTVIELRNDTSSPIDLSNWAITASDQYGLICTIQLSSWILPDDFVVLASQEDTLNDSTGNVRLYGGCTQQDRTIETISLVQGEHLEEIIEPVEPGAFTRKNFTKTYRSGEFSKDFAAMSVSIRTSFYAGRWYNPMPETMVRVSEIMAHARNCSPVEQAADCNDFVKLYNPTSNTIGLADYRLRIGHQGQSSTSSNTYILSGDIKPHQYAVIMKKSDNTPLSITNTGGYVWLEDTYGVILYQNTVTNYPSAGSTTKVGWSWAYDANDNSWKWTSQPTPYNQPNQFVLPADEEPTSSTSSYKPCAANQFRNPLTNRCKLIASTSSSLTPCAANQFRNPTTNRCKSLSSSSNSLTPCKPNQFRNPETNRCKSLASTASSLKPCNKNQERNPLTNRCRNKVMAATADYAVTPTPDTKQNTVGWLAFGGAAALAVGYAGWEWRRELMHFIQKAGSFFTFHK